MFLNTNGKIRAMFRTLIDINGVSYTNGVYKFLATNRLCL